MAAEVKIIKTDEQVFICLGKFQSSLNRDLSMVKFAEKFGKAVDYDHWHFDAIKLFNKCVAKTSELKIRGYCYCFMEITDLKEVGCESWTSCSGSVNSCDETPKYSGDLSNHYTGAYESTFKAGAAEAGVSTRTYIKFTRTRRYFISEDQFPKSNKKLHVLE